MKYNILLLATILFCTSIPAQTGHIRFSGTLKSGKNISVIHLQNIDGVNISIPVDVKRNFVFATGSLRKGFYELDEIGTVYLCPGYKLKIQPSKDGTSGFSGNGAFENNALRLATKQLSEFIPLSKPGQLTQATYYIDVPVFLRKLDSFQVKGELLFNKSADTFFRRYAALNLEYYGKQLLSDYHLYYGTDLKKMEKIYDTISKLDRKSRDYLKTMMSLRRSAHVKELTLSERSKLAGILYTNWDKDNEILFRNSISYRKAVESFLTYSGSKMKYLFPVKPDLKRVDIDILKLKVARGEMSNPYILSYFDYIISSSILQNTTDTAILIKYYSEYLARSSRPDYILDIKAIYINSISYSDNASAPSFSYKNVVGKTISLESLRGKFVYIDVWATWCAPCKAEIPYLKELEAAYHDKNLEFVSISVDEQQHAGRWKEFVKKNELSGIQLITENAFRSSFITKMGINSIPRFILIDPTGKIISADALRPSDEKLRSTLDKLL